MKDLGRHMFGASAILVGLVGLAFGELAGVWQPMPDVASSLSWFPFVVALAFVGGGAAIEWPRTSALGGFILAALFGMFAVLWIKRIMLLPWAFGTWGGFAEELSLTIASIMISLRTDWASDWSRRPALNVLRITFGLCAVAFGFNHFFNLAETAAMVPKSIPPSQSFWAIATGIGDVAAGLAVITLVHAPLATRLLTLMFASYSACIWIPALLRDPSSHNAWAGNVINLMLITAAWVVSDALTMRPRTDAHSSHTV